MPRHVAILGATGLVGRQLLEQLAADDSVSRIHVIGRRASEHPSPKITSYVFDLSTLAQRSDALRVEQIFCALGTTIATAGSQEQFRVVDYDYPLAAARLGLEAGAHHFLLVSALGADPKSRVFYNRVKGELESSLRPLYRSVTIARPSLLLGERAERRRGEELAKKFAWVTPDKYKPIQARTVARALVDAAQRDEPGVAILESRDMRARWER